MVTTEKALQASPFTFFSSPDGYDQKALAQCLHKFMEIQVGADTYQKTTGFCFGLCLIYGMFYIDQLHAWWGETLKRVIDSTEQLEEPDFLADLATDWYVETPGITESTDFGKAIPSRQLLLERICNYVFFNHAVPTALPIESPFTPQQFFQSSFVTPEDDGGLKFEYRNRLGAIETIQSSHQICGNFNAALLHSTIQAKDMRDCILKISNFDHACLLLYRPKGGKRYGLYNPEISVLKPTWYATKKQLVAAILHQLGETLTLNHISTRKTVTDAFDSFYSEIKEPSMQQLLISNHALPFICRYNKELAMQLALNQTGEESFASSIVPLLSHKLGQNWNGMMTIARYNETLLLHLLKSVDSPESLNSLTELFDEKASRSDSVCLFVLFSWAPKALEYLCENVPDKALLSSKIYNCISTCSIPEAVSRQVTFQWLVEKYTIGNEHTLPPMEPTEPIEEANDIRVAI